MIGAPVPGVVNALQVTIPGRSSKISLVRELNKSRRLWNFFLRLVLESTLSPRLRSSDLSVTANMLVARSPVSLKRQEGA